jgi:nucleoid DNA-binding protein
MLKSDILNSLYNKYPSLNKGDLEIIFNLFFKKINQGLDNNKNIELRGFGTFTKKINKAKFVRNPKTNEKIFKKENYKVHFKVGKIMHAKINK